MSALIINGSDIEPYFPTNKKISDRQKSDIYHLTLSIIDAVEKQLPIGFSYNRTSRLVLPHSVFLQNETPDTISQRPTHVQTKMRFYRK